MQIIPEIKVLFFIFVIVGLSLSLESSYPGLINSDWFVPFVTLLVGSFAIYLYLKQKQDSRKDAARVIIQEIRRAEDVIRGYKESHSFQFTKRIIANNSWGKNIHFFVGDLDSDELDKISNLYSTGEFLDTVILRIFNWKFDYKSNEFYEKIPFIKIKVPSQLEENQSGTSGIMDSSIREREIIKPEIAFWNDLLNTVVMKYEPIYHLTIVEKLKRIAKIN